MLKQSVPTTANPKVIVDAKSDVRVIGSDRLEVYVEGKDRVEVQATDSGQQVTIFSNDDVSVRVPYQAQLIFQHIGGDAKLKDLETNLTIDHVGGDLVLRQVTNARVNHVGGDVSAKKLDGELMVDFAGGDVSVRGINGPLTINKAGGDVSARDIAGPVQVAAGADITITLDPQPGHAYTCEAGGDVVCRLAIGASATIQADCPGDVSLDIPGAQVTVAEDGTHKIILKDGGASLQLKSGSDIALSDASFDDGGAEFNGEEFSAHIHATVAESMKKLERDLSGMGSGRLGFTVGAHPEDIERITEQAQRAAERAAEAARRRAEERIEAARRKAEAKAEAATRRAERAAERATRRTREFKFDFMRPMRPPTPPTPSVPPVAPISDEERLTILRMLEQGKITVADAEKLLAALEAK